MLLFVDMGLAAAAAVFAKFMLLCLLLSVFVPLLLVAVGSWFAETWDFQEVQQQGLAS